MEAYGGEESQLHKLSTPTIDGVSGQVDGPLACPLARDTDTH
jgi:hypothetical protein